MSEETKLREAMARFARSLFERGLTPGASGNISARLGDGTWLARRPTPRWDFSIPLASRSSASTAG